MIMFIIIYYLVSPFCKHAAFGSPVHYMSLVFQNHKVTKLVGWENKQIAFATNIKN